MAYLDFFSHEFVGYFGKLPVFHPLEVIPLSDDCSREFACGPEHLVIGCLGEHDPGLVIKQPGETVFWFVRAWIERCEHPYPEVYQRFQPAIESWMAIWNEERCVSSHSRSVRRADESIEYWSEVFEFAGWSILDYEDFAKHIRSNAFAVPFGSIQHGFQDDATIEAWLAESVGEFVFFSMPELARDAIEQLGDLRQLADLRSYWHLSLYENIRILPPGYPTLGRNGDDGAVQWGCSGWQTHRINHPLTIRKPRT